MRPLPKRADLGLERADLRPDRVDFRPERAGGDGQTNKQKSEQDGIGWGADIKRGRLI